MALACKIEDQVYTIEGRDYTYNEFRALLYDGLMQKMAAEAETRGVAMPAEAEALAQDELDSIAEEAVELEEAGVELAGEAAVERIVEFLSDSSIRVEVLDEVQFSEKAKQRNINGSIDGVFLSDEDTGVIFLNADAVRSKYGRVVVFHEGIHPVVNIIRNTDPKLYNAIIQGLTEESKTNDSIKQVLAEVKESETYTSLGQDAVNDEFLVETLARIGDGMIKLNELEPTLMEKIIELLNKIAGILGFERVAMNSPRMEFRRLAAKLSEALAAEGTIADVVGSKNLNMFQNAVVRDISWQASVKKFGKSGIEKRPILDNADFIKQLKDGRLKVVTPEQSLGNELFMLTFPDDLFVGEIAIDKKVIARFGGGVIYAAVEGDKGRMWASVNEVTANSFAENVNRALAASSDGVARVVLVKGIDTKHASSLQAKVGFIKTLLAYAKDKPEYHTQLLDAIAQAYEIDASGGIADVINQFDSYMEATRAQSGQTMKEAADAYNVFRSALVKNANEFLVFLSQDAGYGNSALNVSELKRDKKVAKNDFVDTLFSDFLQEDFLAGLPAGSAYAVLKVTSPVTVVRDKKHPSYPWVIRTKDGSPVSVDVLTHSFMTYGPNEAISGRTEAPSDKPSKAFGTASYTLPKYRLKPGVTEDYPGAISLQGKLGEYGAMSAQFSAGIKRGSAASKKAPKKRRFTAEQARELLSNAEYTSIQSALDLLAEYPQYLNDVVRVIMTQRKKLLDGTLTVRDVAKAYIMTQGSIGSDFRYKDTLEKDLKAAGLTWESGSHDISLFEEDGKIRPEELTAWWLGTSLGKRALDNLEKGAVDQEAFNQLEAIRQSYGKNNFRLNSVLGNKRDEGFEYGKKPDKAGQFNLANVVELTNAINKVGGDLKGLEKVLLSVNGIGDGKKGFIGHMLGIGDMPTIDAVELNFWLTGNGAANVATLDKIKADTITAIRENVSALNETLYREISGRIKELSDKVNELYPDAKIPKEAMQHVLHHWIWDRARGSETTHRGMYTALAQYSALRRGTKEAMERKEDEAFNGIEEPKTPIGDTKTVVVDGKERTVFNSEGRPIHPTVEGVRNFWRWFGDSKVVDAEGRPIVVYHGTPSGGFDEFDLSRTGSRDPGWVGRGFYFTTDRNTGIAYAQMGRGDNRQLYELYAKAENPFEWGPKDTGAYGLVMQGNPLPGFLQKAVYERTGYKFVPSERMSSQQIERTIAYISRAIRDELISRGYDSVITTYEDGGYELMTLDSAQLKSATGNYGTFNPASRNIQASAIERPSKGMLAPGEWNSMVMSIRESLKANKDVDAIMQDLASQGLTDGFDQQKLDALRDRVTASHAKFNQLRGERAGAKPAGAAVPFRKTQKQREIEEEVQAAKPVKMVEVDEMKALKDQIRLEARAASEAVKNVAQKRKEFVAKVSVVAKGFVSGLLGKTIRPNALASIATLAARVDPTNEKQVEGFLKKLDDIIGKAERDKYYEERKTEANNLRKQIKKAAKSGFVKKRDYRLPALATQFASLRIPKAEDIGGYIEVAKALKDLLSGAKVQVTDELVKAINTDAGLTNKALSDYITSRLNSEQAEADQRLLEEFEKIRIENNLEGASLTLDDIKDIMRSLAADQNTIKAQNDKLVKEQKLKMLQTMSRIKLQELKRYRQDKALDKQDAEIVENILKIDAERLTATDAALLIAAINNIILNGSFSGLRTSFAAKGMKDAAMKELQEYAKKMGGFGQPGSEWGINKNTDQVAGLFEKIGKNPTVASILRTLTGFDGMLNSTARAAEMVRDIQEQRKQYAKKVGYKDTTLNRYRMGVYAYLIQNNGGTQEEMDAEFAQRAQDLRESKEMLSDRANYVLGSVEGRIDTALYIRAIDEVLGQAEMLEGVKIDPVLKKMVEWEIKKHGEYTAMHQDAADRDHNSGYGDVENYTAQSNITVKVDGPSQDSKAIQDFIDKQLTQAVFLPTRIKETPAGAKMQRRGKNASQVVDLNFFNVQDRSRKDNFADTFGAKYVALLREMLADDRLSGSDRLVDESTKEHLKAVAKSILGMDDIRTDALSSKAGKVYNYLSRSSSAQALKGVIQIPKQLTPLVSTWFALNPFGKGSQYLTNGLRDATGALDKDSWQYGLIKDLQIAQRYSTMFGINKLGDQVTREAILSGDESKVYELLKRGFNGWSVTSNYLSKSISAPDAFTATASWFAFYRQYLDRSGIDLTKDDWKYQLDEQAAAYANQMVERAQNANTPESMPLVYKNKGIAWRAMMDLFYAFSSFNLNTRKRFNRDVQLLFSGSNEDKRFAGLDLVGMLAEQAAFVTVATASYEFTADMFSQLFGDDDEARRRKKKMRDEDRSFTEKVIANTLINYFLVGLPDIGNDYIKKFVNYLVEEPGKQNLFYVKDGMSLGTMGVIIDETANAIIAANALATGEINNEKISEEDETMLRIALLMSFFNLTGWSDQTFTRATRREAMKRVPPSKEDAEDMIIHSIAAPFVDEEEREKRKRFEERKRRMMQR